MSRATSGVLPPAWAGLRFDPATLTPGIVHLGLGNFHRAHMARYTHHLIAASLDARHWGIIGATLLAQGAPTIAALAGLIDAGGSSAAFLAGLQDRGDTRAMA